MSALCPSGVDTPLLDSRGPDDLPPIALDARRHLRAQLGKELAVDKFVDKALRGVERNRALVVVPVRARVAWRLQRWVPGLVAATTRRSMRKERAAQGPPTGG